MKQLSDRRQSIESQLAYYRTQARLARMGLVTRRSAEFFDRQIQFLQEFAR